MTLEAWVLKIVIIKLSFSEKIIQTPELIIYHKSFEEKRGKMRFYILKNIVWWWLFGELASGRKFFFGDEVWPIKFNTHTQTNTQGHTQSHTHRHTHRHTGTNTVTGTHTYTLKERIGPLSATVFKNALATDNNKINLNLHYLQVKKYLIV